MKIDSIVCDCCGRELEHHGKRYLCRIQRVPAFRGIDTTTFDLCPQCAAGLKVKLGRRDGYTEVEP